MENTNGEQFLHQKDPTLHLSAPVETAKKRAEANGRKISQKPAEKIKEYLQRYQKVLNPPRLENFSDFDRKERNVEMMKNALYEDVIIKAGDIPEGYFKNQARLAREQGHGDIDITQDMRDRLTEVVISDQKSTLDHWVGYFTSADSDSYPVWVKYWAFTGVLKLSTFDKEKHAFGKRDKGTVAPFPDLNREALAYVTDAIIKKANGEHVQLADDSPEAHELLRGANFGKLYAYAIEKVTPAEESELQNAKGEWVLYKKNSDHMPLVRSLQGHGTGWCTAGESTAQVQLQAGDFHVYYSYDKEGKPTIPRIAIRMQEHSIAEVRGIAAEQNLDPYVAGITEAKLATFPDGKAYQKKSADMKRLTNIEKKSVRAEALPSDDLRFLYQMDEKIEGFGYDADPRIAEILSQRNPDEDMLVLFDCTEAQIAHTPKEINETTKAYVGPLQKGLFAVLPDHLEHIYTSFPEGRIRLESLEIGGLTAEELEAALDAKDATGKTQWNVHSYAHSMLNNRKQFIEPVNARYRERKGTTEIFDLVRLRVADFGFTKDPTTTELFKRAQEFGLELCPPETGPYRRLADKDQLFGDWYRIGMEPITASGGDPGVFSLAHGGDGLWLADDRAHPGRQWSPDNEFVFRRRKSDS